MKIDTWSHKDFEHSRYFLRNEISTNKFRMKEPWQSYESMKISKENINRDSTSLAMFSYVEVLLGVELK
jgi:hypothetical protein